MKCGCYAFSGGWVGDKVSLAGILPTMIIMNTFDSRPTAATELILGSSSRYRAELLQRLGLKFRTASPDIDESPQADETPQALALRLGREKAAAIAARHPGAWVIGSDQVATLDGRTPIGKPGSVERALEQLRQASGRTLQVYTSVSLQHAASGFERTLLDQVQVQFRVLNDSQIRHYIDIEKPLDCAGSVRSESLGVALLAKVSNQDPSALVGLPMILLCELFSSAGIDLLSPDCPFERATP